ncbi:MAG: amidohydrolase family protein [Planctomycetota bacterium]
MIAGLLLGLLLGGAAPAADEPFAVFAAKGVVCGADHGVIDDVALLVVDGRIAAVGPRDEVTLPPDCRIVDGGAAWLLPGFVDLHSHVAGDFGINSSIYQSNPGLRVWASVVPANSNLARGLAAGVTTILFIPGSATNFGGQGVLLKTFGVDFADMLVRQPGSLKLAQADNPKRWGWGMGRLSMNWNIRRTIQKGVAYARAWEAFEAGAGPEPDVVLAWEIFRALRKGEAQISAHTQEHQVVQMSLKQVVVEAGLPLFIDHGTMSAFYGAALAEALGVPAILGPRSISFTNKGRAFDHDGKIVGIAAAYQAAGHSRIGFNTDAPVVPQEELALQAAMGVRYGFRDDGFATILGLTIVPARTAGIDARVGSLEVGKDADLVLVAGHPSDPRNPVLQVFGQGRLVYDAAEGRTF